MSAQWPRVKAWAAAKLPTLAGWTGVTVIDGAPSTGDRAEKYAIVGWSPPDGDGGEFRNVGDPDGFQLQESGALLLYLVCQGGDADPAGYAASVFALYDALEAEVRRDRTLGGTLSPNSTADLSAVPALGQTSAALLVTLTYFTVT